MISKIPKENEMDRGNYGILTIWDNEGLRKHFQEIAVLTIPLKLAEDQPRSITGKKRLT